ncbi:hypothetical protein GYMLUDRAFT_70161 [Collybiopsis luxurians FD-317 M1]|nr:hypothetical protein GYMLUDRAFT_70161 [Collybiopsis luxurians FD-317 M1]
MNDPGLEGTIQDTATHITHSLRERVNSRSYSTETSNGESESPGDAFRRELQVDEEEEEVGYFAPQRWWFTSTAFPLVAGTFGPLANLFSVCALVQTWRVRVSDGESEDQGQRVMDPHWLVGLNGASLALALSANLLLLFNFAHRVRYIIAQPLTISLWYCSSILLIVPLALTPTLSPPSDGSASGQIDLSQSYYYALLSAILYATLSTLLLLHLIFSLPPFSKYPASFATLTIPQRTLMLQTISFTLYLALGAGVFAALEGWEYCDGVYWADYTLLTIGLGSDFPLQTAAGRGVLIPYAGGGILLIGIVVGSVRGLILERAGVKMMHRRLAKERDRGVDQVKRHASQGLDSIEAMKVEFETMRRAARRAETARKYGFLGLSLLIFLVIWFLGAMIFFFSESKQNWAYGTALYFSFTSLLTIGYGDLVPQSNSGKPFFVLWTLIAVPSVTILISNMGDTVVALVQKGTMWLGQRTILPERSLTGNRSSEDTRSGPPRERSGGRGKGKGLAAGFLPLKNPGSVEKAVNAEEAKEVEEGAVPGANHSKDGDHLDEGVRGDLEKLGGAVEAAEEERGQGGGMAARLAKEIRYVAKDLGRHPPKEYSWDDWKRWINLFSEGDEGIGNGERQNGPSSGLDGLRAPTTRSGSNSNHPSDHGQQTVSNEASRNWIWLGDDGPLLSNESEAKWILGKLCERLERVLMEEAHIAKNQ